MQVGADPHVGVTLPSSSTWIPIDGEAEVVRDLAEAERLWNAGLEAWLPRGLRDPSVVPIEFTGHSAESGDGEALRRRRAGQDRARSAGAA